MLTENEVNTLSEKAKDIRVSIIEMLLSAGSGHTAGPLGMADVFTALYGKVLRHDPQNPDMPDRDRLILSNGHIAPVLYSSMAHYGYLPVAELLTLRKMGSRLQGHPHREYLPGVETSSGPLGCGLSQAVGMALANRMDSKAEKKISRKFFYCLMGDGELNEGQVWEAAMLAGREKLGNLICIIDRNNIQIDGYTETVMPLEPLDDKWKAFNFDVQVINGNNIREIYDAIERAKATVNQPSMIIAKTVPGKGVPEFESDYHWHGKAPNSEEAKVALKRLRSLGSTLSGHHD
jgi:transketolase